MKSELFNNVADKLNEGYSNESKPIFCEAGVTRLDQIEKTQFSPSLMCMDLLNVEKQIRALNENFSSLHVDIMDGHFCNSIHLSPSFLKAIRNITKLTIEVHLMVENPENYVHSLLEFGADIIILHAETITTHAFRLINEIKNNEKKVGVAVCPVTPLSHIEHLLSDIDMLTLMAVDVGYVGQPLIDSVLNKILLAKNLKKQHGYNYVIQCDGGVKKSTYKKICDSGAENLVIGETALFGKNKDVKIACSMMKKEFEFALNEGNN